MTQQVQDDAFHEIQLNGKQLVFLFMAATVVSVVIFLCGVLVGRGARAQLATLTDTTPMSTVAETTPTQPVTPASAPAPGSDPTVVPPPPPVDELTYYNRLEKSTTPPEKLKTPTPDKKAPEPARPEPAHAPAPTAAPVQAPAPAASAAAAAEPVSDGFAVQIAALNVRGEADAIAKRLASKGYAAYVLAPATGTPSVFRVRVGKFPTRREAESIAARLQKEEQFKPWVTR